MTELLEYILADLKRLRLAYERRGLLAMPDAFHGGQGTAPSPVLERQADQRSDDDGQDDADDHRDEEREAIGDPLGQVGDHGLAGEQRRGAGPGDRRRQHRRGPGRTAFRARSGSQTMRRVAAYGSDTAHAIATTPESAASKNAMATSRRMASATMSQKSGSHLKVPYSVP